MAEEKAKWLTAGDQGLLRIEQVVHASMCYGQHCHHLRHFGHGHRSVPCSDGLNQCFIQYTLVSKLQDHFAFIWEGQEWNFQVFP